MSGRPSSKPGVGIKKNGKIRSSLIEKSGEGISEKSFAAEAYGSIRHERRRGHHRISTDTYYRTERRRSGGYIHDETHDWLEADAETDGPL